MPVPRLKAYQGPAVLSYGFRPFFLLGAIWAIVALAIWLPHYFGEISLGMALPPLAWHVHEMLFGYLAAVIAGFLLTAVPNWTGRLPLQGAPLATLVSLWLAGRLAVAFGGALDWRIVLVLDALFLAAMAAAIAREIVAGRNWRNLKVLVILAALLATNVAFHAETHATGAATLSGRIGVALVVALVMLIGGRVVPSFTRNWLARMNPGALPASPDRIDNAIVGLTLLAMASWLTRLSDSASAALLIAAGVAQAWRLSRWVGWRAWRDPLVLVLHVAYAFIPVGLLLLALSLIAPIPESAGLHAWTIGALGGMTLAVMTRATLGHTGHALAASRTTVAIYAGLFVAALARIDAAIQPEFGFVLLHVAAAGWLVAFIGFAAVYGPMLLRRRRTQPA